LSDRRPATARFVPAAPRAAVLGVLVHLGCNGAGVDAGPRGPVTPEAAPPAAIADAGPDDAADAAGGGSYLVAPLGTLDPLFTALDRAERGDPDGRVLLVFFGDSHTAGDQMTSYLRRVLGGRFGDAGRGLVLAGRPPIRHYYQRDIQFGSEGRWKAELGGKRGDSEPFGLAGVRAHADRKSAVAWVASCDQCGSGEVARFDGYYLRRRKSGSLGVRVDGGAWKKVPTMLGPGSEHDMEAAVLPVPVTAGRHRLSLRPAGGGAVDLFGVALERGTPGVVIDALGVVGRRLGHLRSWDWSVIGPQLAARAPALVVLQYGTNEADDPELDLAALANQYDEVIARIRRHVPGAAILILGPPDMAVRDAGKSCDKRPPPPEPDAAVPFECQWHTPPILNLVVEVQRLAADRNHVAFFDSLAAMGGVDQMDLLFHMDPPMAYSDHVHFTQPGYETWGAALDEALMTAYQQWKQAERSP